MGRAATAGAARRFRRSRKAPPGACPLFRSAGGENDKHQPVQDACCGAVDDDRPGDDKQLGGKAQHHTLCLCQDRDEGNFCPILLGFWLLKFLKKSAFFAKLL